MESADEITMKPGVPPAILLSGPRFTRSSGCHGVPIEMHAVTAILRVDGASAVVEVEAEVRFSALENGFPLLDLVPEVSRVVFDRATVSPELLTTIVIVDDDAETTRLRALAIAVTKGEPHTLLLHYSVRLSDSERFEGGGFFMSDTEDAGGRFFLERYLPANLEFDAHPVNVTIVAQNLETPYRLFANGRGVPTGTVGSACAGWTVEFPRWYTSSSHYLHLVSTELPSPLQVLEQTFQSESGRSIPLIVYSREGRADEGIYHLAREMKEMERRFGEYPHETAILHVTDGNVEGGARGMEYAGAIVSEIDEDLLHHEVAHLWFGRGVLPSDGNSGWIDEAVAQWMTFPSRNRIDLQQVEPACLAGYSPFLRATPKRSYGVGANLMSHFDAELHGSQTNLIAILRKFCTEHRYRTISTRMFEAFLAAEGLETDLVFRKLVWGDETDLRFKGPSFGVEVEEPGDTGRPEGQPGGRSGGGSGDHPGDDGPHVPV